MPFTGTSAWNTATAALAKVPVYVVRFDGLASVQYASGPVASASRTTKELLADIGSVTQHIDPITGAASIGQFSFRLTDLAGTVTDLVSTEKSSPTLSTLLNRKVTLLAGYADIAETDYSTMGVYFVNEIRHSPGEAAYEFVCADAKRPVVEDVFTSADAGETEISRTLASSAAAGSIVVDPNSITDISEDDKFFIRNGSSQEERIEVERITASNKIVTKEALTYAYSSGDELRWATSIIVGNPVNIFYSLLTGTFSTGGSFPLTSFKGDPTGLAIAAGDIDTTMLATERDNWLSDLSLSFEVKQPIRARTFLEQEIYRFFGYPVITPAGKVGFKAFGPRRPTETIFTLTESDILSWRWERRYDLAVNRVVVKYGYDVDFDRFVETRTAEDTTDQSTVGVRERVIESKGLVATEANQRFIDAWARRHLTRYLKGPGQLVVHTHLTKRGATPGETVDVTHSAIPNVRTGARGESPTSGKATGTWEIVRVTQDFEAGQMELTLLDNNWTRPGFIAPAGQADFGAATSDEKRRAYISPVSGANFSDGSEPYKVI